MNGKLFGDRLGICCLVVLVAIPVSVTRADAGGTESEEPEQQVAMKDLPGPVRVSAEKAIAGGAVKRIVVETDDGAKEYSVEATVTGKIKEFTFAPDGTLLAVEEDVTLAQLPEAVRAAAVKYFGNSSRLRASSELAKGVTSYEIDGQREGKRVSAKFSAGGALLDAEADED